MENIAGASWSISPTAGLSKMALSYKFEADTDVARWLDEPGYDLPEGGGARA